MQIAGATCAVCGEKVPSITDAEGCELCQLAFHDRCLDSDECPECGTSFAAQAEAARLNRVAEERSSEERFQRGASHLMVAIFLAVGAVVAAVVVDTTLLHVDRMAAGHVVLAVCFFLAQLRGSALAATFGQKYARDMAGGADAYRRDLARMHGIRSQRMILAVLTSLGTTYAIVTAIDLIPMGALAIWSNVGIAALEGTAAALLIFSPALRSFARRASVD